MGEEGGRGKRRPGRRRPERGGRGDLVSSLAGPATEGRGGESLHVKGIVRNMKSVVLFRN
jgi:hypothetical protein